MTQGQQERERINDIIRRNIPLLRGKGKVLAGYPVAYGGKRVKCYSVHSAINLRALMTRIGEKMKDIMSKNTPEQILAKMKSSRVA